MTIHCQTNVGVQRSTNEDAAKCTTIDGVGTLVAVADGMGGHAKGEVASETAITTLCSTIEREREDTGQVGHDTLLETGFHTAHRAVMDIETDGSRTPGTTLVAALIDDGDATIANVGDSRAYIVQNGTLEQVTVDQSQVQQLVEAGEITPEEAEDHPLDHVLAQGMGTTEDLEVDLYEQSVTDAWLLLCSDGLTDPVPDDDIETICLQADSVEAASTSLIDQACAQGGPDNVAVGLYSQES